MAFLALPSDDELTPDAAEAAREFLASHPGPLSNLDRTLLGSAQVFSCYTAWFTLRDELIPFLGERAVNLFCFAISDGYPAPYPTTFFGRELELAGDDPIDPQVTEAERLLIDWGRALGAGAASVPHELARAVEQTFQPKLRLLLTAFAGLMVAVCVLTVVGGVPSDD
ncbi:MAG TPA: hypothetical protein VFQ74_07820 [Pseudolysinimonas sp.]|nr:hypothetical protein [Pseudolysinimonas sp.]